MDQSVNYLLKQLKRQIDEPSRTFRPLVILLLLVPTCGLGLLLIWLSGQGESEYWSHILLELGIVLIGFAIVDVFLNTMLEIIAKRPTTHEKRWLDALLLLEKLDDREKKSNKSIDELIQKINRQKIESALHDLQRSAKYIEGCLKRIEEVADPARNSPESIEARRKAIQRLEKAINNHADDAPLPLDP